ncbi:hypothetical protein GCM10011502_15900 [Oceanisphaera marina]|uniref:Uncharacterized protein n=1 Tax=Oceanisphaera marina TaxID=2017550 RepID=A0ABQ1IK65_9GAMM|nr:hypothetical protein GCM10011502_15900 [Oceanisphaera marina]
MVFSIVVVDNIASLMWIEMVIRLKPYAVSQRQSVLFFNVWRKIHQELQEIDKDPAQAGAGMA